MELTVPEPVRRIEREQAALVVTPHPLTLGDQRIYSHQAAALVPGESLASFLARHGVVPGQQWVVTIGGVLVHDMHWHRVRPKDGHLIECRRVPEKQVLQIAALVALSYFTFGAGGMAGGSFLGLTGTAGYIAAGVSYMAGSMLINKLLSPKPIRPAEQTTDPVYSLSAGGRNQARMWQPIGLVLGEPYMVPDLGSQPYTYFKDGEQHLLQLFNCGINCADVHTLRVGQTALSSYQGVAVLRSGLATDNTPFPALGTSVDSVAGATLDKPTDDPAEWTVRTSSVGTVRLAVDLVASLFAVDSSTGGYKTRSVVIGIEYRAVGSGTWLPFTPFRASVPAVTEFGEVPYGSIVSPFDKVITPGAPEEAAGVLTLRNASQKPVRRTVELDVEPGQYEVRLSKLHKNYTGTAGANAVEWQALKSYQPDTASYAGQARLLVQVQASGQLNGSLDELNAQGVALPMDCWDGAAWVTATNRATGLCNPGAILLRLARGIYSGDQLLAGLGWADDRIDIEGLKRFMVHCADKGFHFDLDLRQATSVGDLLDAVAAAGMGQIDWPDGRLGVVFYAEDDPIEGVINMTSIKARSFSVDYLTAPTADEVELQYMDRARDNAWTSVRAKVPGVGTPRSTASTQMVGVTGEAHAAALLRFLLAQTIYQRKTVTLEMDLEYMTYRRGQVVSLSHDLTQWGYGGRLLAAQDVGGTVRLTLDDTAPGGIPAGYAGRYIGLRLAGERQMRVFPVKPFSGAGRVIELDAAWPVGVPLPGATGPAHDCLWVYDFKAVPGQLMRVAGIEPGTDGARMTLVPELAEFWDYVANGLYTPPPNNSLLSAAPVVLAVLPSEQLERQGNTYYTELTLQFEVQGTFNRAELWGSTAGFEQLSKLGESRSQSISWRGGLDEVWSLELRVQGDTRAAAPYRIEYTVQGLRAVPPAFDVFAVLAQPDGTRQFNFAYTTTDAPADWLGAEIRYLPGTHTTPTWDAMQPLQNDRTHYTASPVEVNQLLSGPHTFACRSRDTTGNLSAAVYFQITLPPRRLGNVVAEFDEAAESWAGTVAGGAVNTDNNTVEAASTTTWNSITTWDAWQRWSQNAAASVTYTSPVRDFGAVLTALVDVATTAAGNTTVELRSSQTAADPVASPAAWTAWGPADVKVTSRYLQVRVTVAATVGEPLAVLSGMSYLVSAPLMTEYINDLAISTLTGGNRIGTGDVRVPFKNTYASVLELQVVIQDGTGSWTWNIVDKTLTGYRVQFRKGGTLADPALVDFIVKGF